MTRACTKQASSYLLLEAGLLLLMVVMMASVTCWEAGGESGTKLTDQSEKTCKAAQDCPATETKTETESETTSDSNIPAETQTRVTTPPLCDPEINIRPNGTYYDDTTIYKHYNTRYTPTQQKTEAWQAGNLSVMIANTSASVVPTTPILVTDYIVAESYMKPLDDALDHCSIQIGIVELVRRNEQLLLYENPPEGYTGLLLKAGNLYPPINPLHYVICTGEYSFHMTAPFVNMPRNYSHGRFETPCDYNSYMILLSQVQEKINFTCNYTASDAEFRNLNHTELLIDKYILLVSIDRNNYVKSIPIGVHFTYFASVDVMCSDASSDSNTGSDTDTSSDTEQSASSPELPQNFNLYGIHKVRFLNESEIREADFQRILQDMGEIGWAAFQRVPLDTDPFIHPVNETCTINPFGPTALPQCEPTQVLLHKDFRHRDEL